MATNILVIEDDAQIRENLAEMLTLHGFQIETAANGREGISQALLQPPDLILCDIMMPEVDGYQVLEVVRHNRLTATIPFIFLTAKTEPADLRRGMVEGADDYLTKPFTLQNLLLSIESRLQREAQRKANLKAELDSYRHTLAAVSVHEYNTALTGIIGFSSLLMEQYHELNEEDAVMMVKMIKVCGLRLNRSLNNIQLMDLLQQLTPEHASYPHYSSGVSSITNQTVTSCALAIEERQDQQVACQVNMETAQLCLSEANLQICLRELIDNAVKFSGAGQGIIILGEMEGSGYRISVTNQGQPFDAKDVTEISPYKQFGRQKYEQQGFGLGLAIVKTITELNKGQLTIESPLPGVTTVTIWLERVAD